MRFRLSCFIVLIGFLTTSVQAQEGKIPYQLLRVGSEIDAYERSYFNLFPTIAFSNARVQVVDTETIEILISRRDFPDTLVILSRTAAQYLEAYISDFESYLRTANEDREKVIGKLNKSLPAGIIGIPRNKVQEAKYHKIEYGGGLIHGSILGWIDSNLIVMPDLEYDWHHADNIISIPFNNLKFIDRKRGSTLLGMGIGLLGGIGIGVLAGVTGPRVADEKYDYSGAFLVAGIITGIVGGMIVGAIIEGSYLYDHRNLSLSLIEILPLAAVFPEGLPPEVIEKHNMTVRRTISDVPLPALRSHHPIVDTTPSVAYFSVEVGGYSYSQPKSGFDTWVDFGYQPYLGTVGDSMAQRFVLAPRFGLRFPISVSFEFLGRYWISNFLHLSGGLAFHPPLKDHVNRSAIHGSIGIGADSERFSYTFLYSIPFTDTITTVDGKYRHKTIAFQFGLKL